MGFLFGPSTSSIGKVHGRLLDPSGLFYEAMGTLEPAPFGPGGWTGYSPTGKIQGTLTPKGSGPGVSGVQFWGAYGIDAAGKGSFQAYLTTPATVPGQPAVLVGSFSGRFINASEIDPATLLPIPGDFTGKWSLCL